MSEHVPFSHLASVAEKAFGTVELYRSFYGGGEEFTREFHRIVGHLRLLGSRPANGVDARAALFYDGIADALERWYLGTVTTGPRAESK